MCALGGWVPPVGLADLTKPPAHSEMELPEMKRVLCFSTMKAPPLFSALQSVTVEFKSLKLLPST